MEARVMRNRRSKPKNRAGTMALVYLMICMVMVIGFYAALSWAASFLSPSATVQANNRGQTFNDAFTNAQTPDVSPNLVQPEISLNSTNALLIDFHTGEILHYQNATKRMYPASLVKMMTALVAIENIGNLNEMVTLNEAIFAPIHAANATTAGFTAGESVKAIDLLFGLLLPSGAECAIGLALHIAGTEDAFVAMMNARANELGMNNTNFTNTTGLHDGNQYSTVSDMATLLMYALENEMFMRIISTSRHSTADTGLRSGGITFHSTLFSRMASPEFSGGTILGGRTGFTSQAGQNLASFAEVNGRKYILVTSGANANGNHLTQALHIDDAFTVFGAIIR
ncbi:MAG: D-alanyl-D-alanine carboxypeptidase [Defluviitaleaceae bacterium]|nr:D-alanyl-D-alanine carboxypeptidase [Defluviitaleaceae bacterium]